MEPFHLVLAGGLLPDINNGPCWPFQKFGFDTATQVLLFLQHGSLVFALGLKNHFSTLKNTPSLAEAVTS